MANPASRARRRRIASTARVCGALIRPPRAADLWHLREATTHGRIRPVITVFAPDAPGRPGPRILSPQLVRYAGYQAGTAITGDPLNAELTKLAHQLGWPGGQPPGRFDILPLIVREPGAEPTLHERPADAGLEVR